MTEKLKLRESYSNWVTHNNQLAPVDEAMARSIGGEFEAFGIIEREMLVFYGLQPEHYVSDVGCSAGRLSKPLADYLRGPYLGTDIVPELVAYAERAAKRRDWRFAVSQGLEIPESDGKADFVCFFSVWTHLLHEHSYIYLDGAKRVLKSSGRVIASFLEYRIPSHWNVFASTVHDAKGSDQHPLNVFLSREALAAWADHLGLIIREIRDGDELFVPLPHPVMTESGTEMERVGNLGQSICVFEKI